MLAAAGGVGDFVLFAMDCVRMLRPGWGGPPRSPDIGPTSSVAQLSCILSRSAPLALVLGDLGPLSLSISELQFAGTGQCENWIRWLPLSLGAHVSWVPCAGGSKSQVFATSGAFCLEKLRAVKEEVGLCRT